MICGLVFCPWQPEAIRKMDEHDVFSCYSMFKFQHIISICLVAIVLLPVDFRSSCVCWGSISFVTFVQHTDGTGDR